MTHRFALFALLLCIGGNSIAWETIPDGPSTGVIPYGMLPSTWVGDWMGISDVQNHSLRVKVEKGLADVEEECLIVPREEVYGEKLSDQSTPLILGGDLMFPKGSAVVGMLLWNGNTILKAKLKPRWGKIEEYENVVERSSEKEWLSANNPAVLTRVADDTYILTIYPSYLNASRRVRLRYLVPVSSDSSGSYLDITPVLSRVGKVALSVQSDIATQITVLKDGIKTSIEAPAEIEYSDGTSLQIASSVKTTSLRTSFPSGDWKGSYWWMKTGIPKELISKANPNVEVVILWKWNNPEHFIYPRNSEAEGQLTPYGNQARGQACMLASVIGSHGYNEYIAFGLIHQMGSKETNVFPIGKSGSAEEAQLLAYLESIDASFIKDRYPPLTKQYKMTLKDFEAQKKQGKSDFENILKKAVSLYSPDSNTIKYVIVLSAGPSPQVETPSVADLEELTQQKTLFFGVADMSKDIDGNRTSWPGVNLNALQAKYGYEPSKLAAYNTSYSTWYENAQVDFKYPKGFDIHYSATFKNNGVDKIVQLDNDQGEFTIANHTQEPQDSVITWKAYDYNGNELGTAKQTVSSTFRANDSAIAKVVAADPGMTSFKYPVQEIGATWGVVREDYCLAALEGDSVGSVAQITMEKEGLPYLTNGEIFMPERVNTLDQTNHLRNLFIIRNLGAKQIKFEITGKLKSNLERAEIIDISGNVVRQLDVEQLKRMGEITWDGSASGSGVYFLRVKAQGVVFQKNFAL